jgi:hypothetical protein
MKVAKARIIRANSSGEPKARATSASGGANNVNKITEIVPPTKEAVAAAMRAWSALLSSPLVMYHFVVEFLALAVSCLKTDGAGCDCIV